MSIPDELNSSNLLLDIFEITKFCTKVSVGIVSTPSAIQRGDYQIFLREVESDFVNCVIVGDFIGGESAVVETQIV